MARRPGILAVGSSYLLFGIGYWVTTRLDWLPRWPLPFTALDRAVPLTPVWAFVYASHGALCLLPYVAPLDPDRQWTTLRRYVLATLVGLAVFVVLPTSIERPPPEAFAGRPGAELLAFVYRNDPPTNCFPSLHAAFSAIAADAFSAAPPVVRWSMRAWALAIAFSVLATRQHVAIDLFAGWALAAACGRAIRFPSPNSPGRGLPPAR